MDADAGDTVTVVTTGAGGGVAVTVIAAVPDFPAHVAVIVAEPAPAPDTTPLELTVAADALLVDQVTVCPVIVFPLASFTAACNEVVAPTPMEAEPGETVTVVTTGAGGGGGGGGAVLEVVDASTTFELGPKTAFELRVPRKAFTWKS
jgi:hypothetical protein